ncbi:universal stress protein [Trujillonella endophytica]|uniref:Nucleotide-binding universal stress protein, UspA family n=1 Tax=Trujillonella endophytica TaxID=673521 RepID=A0A1H8RVG8_9ACTN|nr:universal stress protein [Trujillella endophytica]SEO70370.1 Nucleotide-binding universal stress protein, UspA family [Trujillella endophytica]
MTGAGVSAGGRVVVGVDGSEPSVQAALYAAEAARRRGVGLLVVHVTPWQGFDDALPMAGREVKARFEESATLLVEAAADTVRQETGSGDVTAAVVDDHPVDGLLALSADAALVVIGRRGLGGLPGLLLGSTAGAVAQHARCPVIALPEEWDETAARTRPVVVGIEGGSGDDEVLAFAVAEAASRATGLEAVHAWRDPSLEAALGGFGPFVDWSVVEEDERGKLSRAVAGWRDREPGVPITETVVRDRAAAALLDASAGAELLVVGHRHRGRFGRVGSTTYGLLHRAACPVAVVPLER